MISSLFDQGGQFLNVAATTATPTSTYPLDGFGAGTTTAGQSILADATRVCILAIVFRTSSQTGVITINKHSDNTNVIQNLSLGTANTGSRTIDFGPIGLLMDGGFYIQQAASAPAVTVVYKKIA